MRLDWTTLATFTFGAAGTKTSPGFYVGGAELTEFEFTASSGSGVLSTITPLYDPTADGTAILSVTNAQATAPALGTYLPEAAQVDFADVIGKALSLTAPLIGRVAYVAQANGLYQQTVAPYPWAYLQLVASAAVTVVVRYRAKWSDSRPLSTTNNVVGSVQ